MKRALISFSLLLFLPSAAYAQEERAVRELFRDDVVHEGFLAIGPDLYSGTFSDVMASGVTPLFDEAVETAGEVTDPEGQVFNSRMTFVPFVNSATGKHGYFIRVSVSSLDGRPLFDHESTIHDEECDCLSLEPVAPAAASVPSVEAQAAAIGARALAQLVKYIIARSWPAVSRWISQQLANGVKKAALADAVKRAFRDAGYRCPDLPWWIPAKTLIYVKQCKKR